MGWATAADTCTHTLLRIEPRNLASNKNVGSKKNEKERAGERAAAGAGGGGREVSGWGAGAPQPRVRTPQNVYTHHAGARDKCVDGGPPIHPD